MAEVLDLAEARRRRGAKDDGRCSYCRGARVVCSPMGRPCCHREEQ